MRAFLLMTSLAVSLAPAIAMAADEGTDAAAPLQSAQAGQGRPPTYGTPPGFRPPPGGDRPTHNGDRPTPGAPNYPGPTNVPPRTNGQQERRLNPTGDPDVQRGIDEYRRTHPR